MTVKSQHFPSAFRKARHSMGALALSALCALPAGAGTMQAHSHGHAQMTLVMAQDTLTIELISPAANLVGFEHRASSKDEKAALSQVRSQLEQADTLVNFSDGECVFLHSEVDTSALNDAEDQHEHEHAHHSAHGDITAEYHYHCENNAYPTGVALTLFKHYPAIHEIELMWVSPTAQGGGTLSPKLTKTTFEQ